MRGLVDLLDSDFATLSEAVAVHGRTQGSKRAIVEGEQSLSYEELDSRMSQVAAGLQRDGINKGDRVGIVSLNSIHCALVMLGALRAGCVPVPMPSASTSKQISAMVQDSDAKVAFFGPENAASTAAISCPTVPLDDLEAWLPADAIYSEGTTDPSDPFNIIYSSGTTGIPKGIVQSHLMRWRQIAAYRGTGLEHAAVLIATPLYSNTTLVVFLPTLLFGGTVLLLKKFDARDYLEIAEREHATHTMLVPVQYQRIMAVPDFNQFDLSSFLLKACTSAPFAAELKADVVRRWPGMLLEMYGMTEGGGTCLLYANLHPDKLHTVGTPAPGHDIRIIGEDGRELPAGEVGEVVGRSGVMMAGYHGRSEDTVAIGWEDSEGNRFIRHGDLGKFDDDGFLILLGRSKDLIISGGFNVYPVDLEKIAMEHADVADAAVVGVPSEKWGETPFLFFVSRTQTADASDLVEWVNLRVAKTQRILGAEAIEELPRSAIGKVLKRELQLRFRADHPEGTL